MRYSAVAAFLIVTTVLLSACEQQESTAAVEDKSHLYFGRNRAPLGNGAYGGTVSAASVDSIAAQDLGPQASVVPVSAPAPAPSMLPFGHATPAPQIPVQASAAPTTTHVSPLEQLSWQWPVKGRVSAGFGKQREGVANNGITIAAAEGAPIHASAAGEVAFVGENVRDYGNMVILRHAGGDMTSYAHAERVVVAKGMSVRQGDIIAYVGSTGGAKTPQLHFAMRSGAQAIDPLTRLPSHTAAL
jgi:hypothetical protein